MDWYLAAMRRSFDFGGRAHRRAFGWFIACLLLFSLVVSAVFEIAGREVASVASALFTLLHLPAFAAACARRLHDTGRSGWWQLLLFVPVLGFVALLVLMVLRGEAAANRFGPPVSPEAPEA